MLSGVIAKKYGEAGLPEGTVKIKFKGSAGQSFGAFAVKGLDIRLEGEANDYFGKGLSGGRISILPPARHSVTARPSRQKRTSSPVTQDFMVPPLVNSISMVRLVSASACVTLVLLLSSRVLATTAVNT